MNKNSAYGVALAIAALAGCSDGAAEGDGSAQSRIDYDKPATTKRLLPAFGLVAGSCTFKESVRRRLVEFAGLAPEDMGRKERPQDQGWLPTHVIDLAERDGRVAVLDRQNHNVTVMSAKGFTERKTFGRHGKGPGEFEDPIAVTWTRDGSIVVVDNGPARVHAFTSSGQHIATTLLPSTPSDVVAGDDGTIYVSHAIFLHGTQRSIGTDTIPLVSTLTPDFKLSSAFLSVDKKALQDSVRFALPGPNPVRLAANGEYVAVAYTAAGVVDVYENGARAHTVKLCMPDGVLKSYAAQRKAAAAKGGHEYFHRISDVAIGSDGILRTITFTRDQHGHYHVDQFSPSRDKGAIIADGKGLRMPNEVRFLSRPNEVAGFDSRGIIALLRFEK